MRFIALIVETGTIRCGVPVLTVWTGFGDSISASVSPSASAYSFGSYVFRKLGFSCVIWTSWRPVDSFFTISTDRTPTFVSSWNMVTSPGTSARPSSTRAWNAAIVGWPENPSSPFGVIKWKRKSATLELDTKTVSRTFISRAIFFMVASSSSLSQIITAAGLPP